MVSYAFGQKYQSSNQWVLETMTTAMSNDVKITSREQSQSWLKTAGYKPSELKISALKRLGARAAQANIAFDDHPNDLRYADRIKVVTVDSMVDFLKNRDAQTQVYDLSPIKK